MRRFPASLRRTLVDSMALLFTLQSAGSALATTPQSVSLRITPLSVQIASAVQSLRGTHIGAILSGDGSRWAAMHAPPPVFKHDAPPQIVPPDRHVNDSRESRTGVFRPGPRMLSRPLNANEVPKDPRAMAHPARSPISTPCISAKTLCVTRSVRTRGGIQTMSITPTVQPFLFEADTTSGPTTPIFVTAGIESGAISRTMDSAPANPSANQMLTYAPYSGSVSFGWVSPANVPNSTSWPARTYTITLNVGQANPNLKIIVVKVLRVDSSGGGGTGTDGLATVGALTGLSQSLGTTGTIIFNVSGAAQIASATDRVAIKIVVQNTATTTQSFSYLAGQNSGSGLNLGSAGALGTSTTGINPWWTYQGGTLPGHGKYMVNVGNGNLLVQATDVDIPERGIDLAFRRTYNSQSAHDSTNTDGSVPGDYGDGWTNTFDAHLAYGGANAISVYDIDGARYDYVGDGNGGWVAPAGQHAILKWDGSCGYQWTKKNGTVYYFYSPDLNETANCSLPTQGTYPQDIAYGGRLYEIWARNHNNNIIFTYWWANNDASNPSNLQRMQATHADGHALVLDFQPSVSGGPTVLQKITRPDGQIINYFYASNGSNLQWVYLPGNGAYSVLKESYGYNSTGHQLHYATSPRYNATSGDGNVTYFNYDGSNHLTQSYDWGLVNFTPADNTSIALQPGSTSLQTWRTVNYSGYGSGTTSMSDRDGHATNWTVPNDSTFRVTLTQESTGETSPTYLVTTQKWDSNNNLIETTDARGNATDYAYDANGNTIAVALPSVTIGGATFRPTSLYSYDVSGGINYNNVTSYCDPISNHTGGRDWSPSTSPTPVPSACPTSTPGPGTVYTWDHASDATAEPFGRLSDTYTPLGYHTNISYDSTKESNVDAGLPTTVQAASAVTQNDGTSRAPTESFTYDAYGNVITFNKGLANWSLSYDTLNSRVTSTTDPTGVVGYKYYNADGSLGKVESAYQHATGSGTTFVYDADGNAYQQSVSHGGAYNASGSATLNSTAATTKYYDGDDRLVEVVQPQDSRDIYSKPWITRYIYDLSQNGTYARLSYQGRTLIGYGNLVKTQEFLPSSTIVQWSTGQITPTTFQDLKAESFDPLDRVVAKYQMTNTGGTSDVVNQNTNSYDGSGQYGLLTSSCNALNQCAQPSYDVLAQTIQMTYSDGTPTDYYTFDADGRASSAQNTYGTIAFTYDGDGRKTQSVETLGSVGSSALTSAATLTYHYYADGRRSSIDVASSALNQSSLFSYAYRVDGALQWQQINDAANSSVGTTVLSMIYDKAGRLVTRNESGPGANAAATTITYNTTSGFATQQSYAGGTLSNIEYDASGAPLGYQSTPTGGTTTGYTYTYTVRGELASQSATSQSPSYFANGVAVGASVINSQPYKEWDALAGVMLGTSSVPFGTGTTGSSYTSGVTFDGAGRMTDSQSDSTDSLGNFSITMDNARQFDVRDHLDNETFSTTSNGKAAYEWGPNGHPIAIGSGYSTTVVPQIAGYDTLHWDGEQILFTTNPQGSVDDIKVGDIADITPSGGLIFYDRAFGNEVSFCHSHTGFGGNGSNSYLKNGGKNGPLSQNPCGLLTGAPATPLWLGSANQNPLAAGVGQGGILVMPRSDGISDGYNSIQGSRTFDAAVGSWTAPDAFAGEVHDPMTQKAYVWNHNNGASYSDPTGYDAFLGFEPDWVLGFGHTWMVVFNGSSTAGDKTMGDLFSWGPIIPFAASGLPGYVQNIHGTLKEIQSQYMGKDQKMYGFRLRLNPQQDAQLRAYWRSLNESGQNYNVATNNCADKVAGALRAVGMDKEARMISLYPGASAAFLVKNGYLATSLSDVADELIANSANMSTGGTGMHGAVVAPYPW